MVGTRRKDMALIKYQSAVDKSKLYSISKFHALVRIGRNQKRIFQNLREKKIPNISAHNNHTANFDQPI